MERRNIGCVFMENPCCEGKPVIIYQNNDGSYACECSCGLYNSSASETVSRAIYEWEFINELQHIRKGEQ